MKKYLCKCKTDFINRKCIMTEEKSTVFCNKEQKLIDLKQGKSVIVFEMGGINDKLHR